MPADGSGRNGVLVVLEAAGEDEEASGLPTVGRAGYYLWTQLSKLGLERDEFRIHNVLSCRPPGNRLSNQPYESDCITHCSPNLDRTIADHRVLCERLGKHQVILALGRIALKRIMGWAENEAILKEDYHGYVHRSDRYDCWVLSADHPAFLMRGQHHLVPVLQYSAQRAVEIATDGFSYHQPQYLCDPSPVRFTEWLGDYRSALDRDPANTFLSFDIETPMKSKKGEDQLAREDDEDYIILRCSFAFRPGEAVSVPWTMEYLAEIERLFLDPRNQYVTWNGNYDIPRVKNQVEMKGVNHDAMLAWHVLNSALDKRLGMVAPFYAKDAKIWKHLSGSQPAFYNAQDADMALRNYLGIRQDLIRGNQMKPFDRHIVQLNRVLDGMSAAGLQRDEVMRSSAETRLTRMLEETEQKIQGAVPPDARRLQVFKGKPRNMEGVKVRQVRKVAVVCPWCKKVKPPKSHFRVMKKNANVCAALQPVEEEVTIDEYYKEIIWKPSTVQLIAYQAALKQNVIRNRDGRATFDEDAIDKLMRKYPKDPLYPLLLEHRKVQKLRGTYIGVTQPDGRVNGGLRVGRDGLIHPEFTHNPSTLRMACQNPNMQNLPRSSKKEEDLENIVRNLVVARPGYIFLEADYSAIEAVLSAYFARWRDGIRLAKLGVHSYLASHVLGRPADLKWDDDRLRKYFKDIKGSNDPQVNMIYNGCKRAIHLSNYGGTPRKMVQAEPDTFPTVKYATELQEMYFEVAAPIRKWQLQTQLEAHQNGFLRNPFDYIHRFTHVFRNVKEAGKWVRKPGDQANDVLAFLPQSTAAGIIKEAMLRLWEDPQMAAAMRLQVHDSLLLEVREAELDEVRAKLISCMTAPVKELPLPASFRMGEALVIDVDSKVGYRWGAMK